MIGIVPHVNRQEIYVGKKKEISKSIYDERYYGYQATDKEQANVSPIDFFETAHEKHIKKWFPLFKYASRNLVRLDKGDCVFMPAFYYYQIKGYNLKTHEKSAKHNQELGTGKFPGQMSTIV